MTRILVTGSRDWTDPAPVRDALIDHMDPFGVNTVVHGAARGLDTLAADIARQLQGFRVEAHPADWGKSGKAAGPIRNRQMVELGADVVLAFPLGESRGTRDCMRAAEMAGIPVVSYEGAHR